MCLFSVRREEDYEPVRIRERRTHVVHRDRAPSIRASRVSVQSTHRERDSAYRVPAPTALAIPAPQPVPVFIKPPTPPPAAQATEAHYVTVSPRSSSEDSYYRREVRVERDYSPARSHHSHRSRSRDNRGKDDRYEYQYVDAPPRSRSRHRSRSRYEDDYDIEYTRTRERDRRYYD
ncbi:hypothetical protein NA57DRAFT_56412 [Rhizodiscina lignyota]|uniref:Uncharacterized protein n=1 Tax=Rhizodiscina lignyota TaxID=1504668 RepID=A0A9P4MAH9_9PEZI|nr:hypothetical protein NA57DRAFT_56412 [Rhizodiscina lignyota]